MENSSLVHKFIDIPQDNIIFSFTPAINNNGQASENVEKKKTILFVLE